MLYYDARSKYDEAFKNVGKRKKSKNDIFFSDSPWPHLSTHQNYVKMQKRGGEVKKIQRTVERCILIHDLHILECRKRKKNPKWCFV